MKIKTIIISLILSISFLLQAQEQRIHYDVVYLKNGSEFRGELLEYQPDYVKLKALGGRELTFQQKQIKKIVQEPIRSNWKERKPYEFKERGIYKAVLGSANFGTFAWNDDGANGLGFKGIVGYQWNRWIGAGIGIGIENYYLNQGETVYPIFAEIRGYLRKQNVSPYYSFSGGYSFTIKNEEAGITDASGGYLLHPALGIRFGGSANANFTVDAGLQFQKASFTRAFNGWNGPETSEHRMLYQRLAIRLGMLF